MLDKTEAEELLTFKFPGIRVEAGVDYEDLWVFRAFMPIGGGEENMDPFISVHKETGNTNDFSVMACKNPVALMHLFAAEDGVQILTKPSTPQDVQADQNPLERR